MNPSQATYPMLVRILRMSHSQHAGRGWLVSGARTYGVVQPFGHKHPERIPWHYLKPWASANARHSTIANKRKEET